MTSIVQTFQNRTKLLSKSLPLSQPDSSAAAEQSTLRRRLASLSLKLQPISSPSSSSISWSFPRSKSVSSMGEFATTSVKNWWGWGWTWVLSRKPIFAQDLEMNEQETKILGSQNKGSWRHVLFKVRSEFKKIIGGSSDNVRLPQTFKYDNSFKS